MGNERPLKWIGSSKNDYLEFPVDVRKIVGYALGAVQDGKNPDDIRGLKVKALRGFTGGSVMEIIENYDTNTYRAVYTANIGGAVYVLHCFQKKSKSGIATPKPDLKVIETRFKSIQEMIHNEK